MTLNDPYRGRTAPLTSKFYILYIYSTNIGTEYFKHAIYSPFFLSLQNAACFIILTYLVPVLFAFFVQGVLKLKKKFQRQKFKCILVFLMKIQTYRFSHSRHKPVNWRFDLPENKKTKNSSLTFLSHFAGMAKLQKRKKSWEF